MKPLGDNRRSLWADTDEEAYEKCTRGREKTAVMKVMEEHMAGVVHPSELPSTRPCCPPGTHAWTHKPHEDFVEVYCTICARGCGIGRGCDDGTPDWATRAAEWIAPYDEPWDGVDEK